MSISPPLGQLPGLKVQKAGHCAHPPGICSRSMTMIESAYDLREVMRILSRPREPEGNMSVLSARITNLFPEATNENSMREKDVVDYSFFKI